MQELLTWYVHGIWWLLARTANVCEKSDCQKKKGGGGVRTYINYGCAHSYVPRRGIIKKLCKFGF